MHNHSGAGASSNVSKQRRKVVPAGNIVGLDDKNLYIRNTRVRMMIKLDANNAVCTMDMWICLDETGPDLAGQG